MSNIKDCQAESHDQYDQYDKCDKAYDKYYNDDAYDLDDYDDDNDNVNDNVNDDDDDNVNDRHDCYSEMSDNSEYEYITFSDFEDLKSV